MRYSIEPSDRIYVKDYGFLSFVKNIGKNATKVAKSMSNKYSQKLLDSAKNLQMMQQKLLQKEQFKKLQKQLMI